MKSLKSHYGWHSVQAQADFLWFSGGGGEMRGAKFPAVKNPNDRTRWEEEPLKWLFGGRARLFRSNEGKLV